MADETPTTAELIEDARKMAVRHEHRIDWAISLGDEVAVVPIGKLREEAGRLRAYADEMERLTAEVGLLKTAALDRVPELIDRRPDPYRRVLRLEFGFGGDAYSRSEVARILQMSRARVGQIEGRAFEILALAIGWPDSDKDGIRSMVVASRVRILPEGVSSDSPVP